MAKADDDRTPHGGPNLTNYAADLLDVVEPTSRFGAGVWQIQVQPEIPVGEVLGTVRFVPFVFLVNDPRSCQSPRSRRHERLEGRFDRVRDLVQVRSVDVGVEGVTSH